MKQKLVKSNKKQQTKKIILTSFAVGAAGILGYFGWQYLKKKRKTNGDIDAEKLLSQANIPAIYHPLPASPKPKSPGKTSASAYQSSATIDRSAFPLQKGSRGEKVKGLQEALLKKYGNSILPKYGADGDFGTETLNALKKLGLPTTISESTFNVLTQVVKVNPGSAGKELFQAASAKDFNKIMSLLKNFKSTEDYNQANKVFKVYRLNGVRQTIVNGLLNVFTKTDQKEKIKFEFLRMGLQFDGDKWSLSGIDGRPIITNQATTVWVNAREAVKVPPRMVLGNEVSRRLDYTLFENKGMYFLVPSRSVQYL